MLRKSLTILTTCFLLALSLATVSAQDATPEATAETLLLGTEWQWQEYQGMDDLTLTVDSPSDYLLTLNEDGSIGLRADCNVGTGSYTLDGSQLTILPGAMTLVMCSEESLSGQYLNYLNNVASYVIEDGDLFLSLTADGGIMRFSPTALTGVEWQWQELQSMDGTVAAVDLPANYLLMLNEDGTVNVKADCNNASGTYTLNGEEIAFSPMATTMMACPGESQGAEYLTYLTDVVTFSLRDGELFLALPMDGGILRFVPAAPPITDVVWHWQDFQSMDGTLTEVDTPENYTLTLNADGTVTVQADCNSGSGSYTVEGSALSFGAFVTTRVACPEDSLSDAYLGYLADVRTFVAADGELFLALQMDGGIMRFAQAQ